jgi:soluble lytic murein transglycosylase-like protein
MGVAHSQPKPGITSAPATQLVWQQPVTTTAKPVVVPAPAPRAEEIALAPAQPNSSPDVSEEMNTPSALLSDVSTMDLMMPIAEPDLNIASQQSLWAQVGKESGVDPLLLYSVALVESRSLLPGGQVAPTPWLFRVNDHLILGERHHVQLEMAVASQLGSVVQDVGIMQVYYPMHRDAVRDPLTLLDPRTNISVAAKILRDGMHETRDPVLGVGYYHSHTPDLARNYGVAVMTVYQRLKTIYRPGKTTRIVAR